MSEHPTSFAGLFPKTKPPVAKPYVDGGHLVYPPPQRTWVDLIRGVRVEGDTVVITVKGGNDEARCLCGELINEMELNT